MLKPQVVLISGASSGIGAETAIMLARKGFRVFGTSRNIDSNMIDEIEILQLDVRDEASIAKGLQNVIDRAGRLDVLINNAGYAHLGAVEETTIAEAKAVFETDFFGAVRMTNAVLPLMRRQGSGKIINMSVMLGLIGQPFGAFLSASKHALEGYTESLRYEVKPFNIAVSLVEPSFVRTNASIALQQAGLSLDEYRATRDQVVGRFIQDIQTGMEPEEVAKVILRIIQSRSPHLRYPVGRQVRVIPPMKHLLPQAWFESLAQSAYGLSGKQRTKQGEIVSDLR